MNKEISIVTDIQINKYLKSLGSKLNETHTNQFIEMCKGFNLNPFKREIYGIGFGNNFNIVIGYEVFLKRAERSGCLTGWRFWTEGELKTVTKEVNFKDKLGNWKKKFVDAPRGIKGCIEIHRKDWEKPFYHEVYIEEYSPDNKIWCSKPRTMIKKVAAAQGFRLAFPVELGGLPYIEDELSNVNDIPPEQTVERPEPQKKPKVHAVIRILMDKLTEKNIDVKAFSLFAGFKSSDIESCQLALNQFDDLVNDYNELKESAA